MIFTNFQKTKSSIGLQFTTNSLKLLILALIITHSQLSSAADYDSEGGVGPSGDGGGGGGGDVVSANDEIYETSALQQDMDEHEKKNRLLKHLEDEEGMNATTELPQQQQQHDQIISNESMNAIQAQARIDDMINEDSQQIEEEAEINETISNLPTTTTQNIPAYVRRPKAEHFPRTILGGSVSVEEADANVSSSDYVDDGEDADEDHMEVVRAQTTNKIDPIAMKLYHQTNVGEDNTLKDQHPTPPSQRQPQQAAATSKNQLHTNNSDEEYYDDFQDASFETQHLHHPRMNALSTMTPAAMITPLTSTSRSSLASPALGIGIAKLPNENMARAHAIGVDWPTTTNSIPIMVDTSKAATTTMGIIPVAGEKSFNAITPTSATTTAPAQAAVAAAVATGLGRESTITITTTARTTTKTTPIITTTSTSTSTTPLITTTRPTGKQGKQINIPRGRKLLPHEQLRNYIEDAYIRMPLAVIVDPSSDALEKTKALWGEALRTELNIKIVLVSLNASGIPAAYNFNNTRQFLAGLNSIKVNDGGNSFVGILHASELVPYDSAVFISTAAIPPHTELVQDAAITLLKKRIRLYLIWYGERSLSENETQEAVGGILGEVAIRSGGEVLHLVGSENSQELEGSTLTLVADAYVGSQEIDIPVDTTLSSLHVKIDAPMRMATLETPNGG